MVGNNSLKILMGLSLLYSLIDVALMDPDDCMISMQRWTCVSYLNVMLCKLAHTVGKKYSHVGENFIFSLRQKSVVSSVTIVFIWSMLIPFIVIWTVLGTIWFHKALKDHPGCLSHGLHPWLVMCWQGLSYMWVSIYVIYFGITCSIEYKTRMAERNMRRVQDDDSLARWGRMSAPLPEITSIAGPMVVKQQHGMQPCDIFALPSSHVIDEEFSTPSGESHCPICLVDFRQGDNVRTLPRCGHFFHQSCVDLWLLRRAECPMCKGKVE